VTAVRVLPQRALSLTVGEGDDAGSVLHLAGAELELDVDEAKELAAQGFVESVK
jgi:hypothetical protein